MKKVREALDTIAIALTDHDHKWTREERNLYHAAIRTISKYALSVK